LYPAAGNLLSFRCVALLYALFNIELKDEVSDTTTDAMKTQGRKIKAQLQIILKIEIYVRH
jgi:hypothetical protein